MLNRTTGRLAKAVAVGALGAAVVLGASACSSGKISQTNNQLPAVNGGAGSVMLSNDPGTDLANGSVALRNVQIVYPSGKADQTFANGGPFDVSFLISNDSNTRKVKLVEIISPEGTIDIAQPSKTEPGSTPRVVEPGGYLLAGTQANVNTSAAQSADIYRYTATLTDAGDSVASGLTVPLTFKFEVLDLSGKRVEEKEVTVNTPVDDGALEHRIDVIRDPQKHIDDERHGGEH